MKVELQIYESEHNSIAYFISEKQTIYVKRQYYRLSKLAQRFIIEYFQASLLLEDLPPLECYKIAIDTLHESFGIPLLNLSLMIKTEINPLFK
jgi:hypothetical protein